MDRIPGLRLGPFEYTTVQALRDEGILGVDLGDDRARRLIRQKSQLINEFTEQWFAPVRGTALLDGRDSKMIFLPNAIDIIQLEELRLIDRGFEDPNAAGYLVDPREYVVQNRWVELVDIVFRRSILSIGPPMGTDPFGAHRVERGPGRFIPPIPQAVKLVGAFGHLVETRESPWVGVTSADITPDDTTAVLTGSEVYGLGWPSADYVNDLVVGEILTFGRSDACQRAIITKIGPGNLVTFPKLDRLVPAGTEVRVYGRVPRAVEQALQILVYLERCQPFAKTHPFQDSIIVPGSGGAVASGISTGSLKADLLLSPYVAPIIPRLV
jgi:hypothetical protein